MSALKIEEKMKIKTGEWNTTEHTQAQVKTEGFIMMVLSLHKQQ